MERARQDRFMTVTEVADLLHLSEHTVRILLGKGSLPGTKLGSVWRIDRDQLERKFVVREK